MSKNALPLFTACLSLAAFGAAVASDAARPWLIEAEGVLTEYQTNIVYLSWHLCKTGEQFELRTNYAVFRLVSPPFLRGTNVIAIADKTLMTLYPRTNTAFRFTVNTNLLHKGDPYCVLPWPLSLTNRLDHVTDAIEGIESDMRKAENLAATGEFAAAADMFAAVLPAVSNSMHESYAKARLACCLYQVGQYEKAIGFCDEVVTKWPRGSARFAPFIVKADCLTALGKTNEAIRAYREHYSKHNSDVSVTDEDIRKRMETISASRLQGSPSEHPVFPQRLQPVATADSPNAVNNAVQTAKYDVVITGVVDEKKIAAIKAVREVTGLGLKDAKDLVEGTPSIVKRSLSKSEAESIAAKLRESSLLVEIRQPEGE